jgi:hypothetical protein
VPSTRTSTLQSRNLRRLAIAGAATIACAGITACGSSAAGTASSATAPTSAASATSAPAASTAATATQFTTKLAGYCPSTLTIQTNWLPEPDYGALYELIGPGGTKSQYSYEGPLGDTGIKLDILSGGPGAGNLTTAATLYTRNPVKGVTPQLSVDTSDTTIAESKQFPTVGVVTLQELDPQVLIWDPSKFSDLTSIAALTAAAHKGAKFYVGSTTAAYVQYLIDKGVPASSFIGGYTGDLDKFATGQGEIINQGYSDSEVYLLEHDTPAWNKPVNYVYIYKLGLSDYSTMVQVKTGALASMTPCLDRLVPMIQQATVDYFEHPEPVNSLFEALNPKYGVVYWTTSAGYNSAADHVMLSQDIVGNSGTNQTGAVGSISQSRIEQNLEALLPIYGQQKLATYNPKITAPLVATDKFIDPKIKFSTKTGNS